jgi:hypothetical protein
MSDQSRAEPTVIDIRAGLTAEVLAELHLTHELFVARKSDAIGVFGYWIEQPAQTPRLVVLVLNNIDAPAGSTPTGAPASEEPIMVKLARADPGWERALRLLQPGDVIDLRWMGGHAAALLVQPPGPAIQFSFVRSVGLVSDEMRMHLDATFMPDLPSASR